MHRTKEELIQGIHAKLDSKVAPIQDNELRMRYREFFFHKYLPFQPKRRKRAERLLKQIHPEFLKAMLKVEKDVSITKKIDKLKKQIEKEINCSSPNIKFLKRAYTSLFKIVNDIQYLEEEAKQLEKIGAFYESAEVYFSLYLLNKKEEYIHEVESLIIKAKKFRKPNAIYNPYKLKKMGLLFSKMLNMNSRSLIKVIQTQNL
jgi:hypothetical protein